MAIIDLIQSCQLQLDPLPALEEEFNKATNTFFEALEAQEAAHLDTKRVTAAANLRNQIQTYRDSCATTLGKYGTDMGSRQANESKAKESVQVTSVANEDAAKKQTQLVQSGTSSVVGEAADGTSALAQTDAQTDAQTEAQTEVQSFLDSEA